MLFHHLNEQEIRQTCKAHIETLELWLRKIVTDRLKPHFGENFLQTPDTNGNYILNSESRRKIVNRQSKEPDRYPRLIDATLLDELIDIICSQNNYKVYFSEAFRPFFDVGMSMFVTCYLHFSILETALLMLTAFQSGKLSKLYAIRMTSSTP